MSYGCVLLLHFTLFVCPMFFSYNVLIKSIYLFLYLFIFCSSLLFTNVSHFHLVKICFNQLEHTFPSLCILHYVLIYNLKWKSSITFIIFIKEMVRLISRLIIICIQRNIDHHEFLKNDRYYIMITSIINVILICIVSTIVGNNIVVFDLVYHYELLYVPRWHLKTSIINNLILGQCCIILSIKWQGKNVRKIMLSDNFYI